MVEETLTMASFMETRKVKIEPKKSGRIEKTQTSYGVLHIYKSKSQEMRKM